MECQGPVPGCLVLNVHSKSLLNGTGYECSCFLTPETNKHTHMLIVTINIFALLTTTFFYLKLNIINKSVRIT